ncbi:MAG: nitroreductase family protein [Chloroflexi bacterium]|nr:nitroreductase family protein [Chloroflexota bacterium]
MNAYQAIIERRSLRQLNTVPVAKQLVQKLLYAAVLAPAPHHTKPWRFVMLESDGSRKRLAEAMGAAWREDLERDGVSDTQIAMLLSRSQRQIESAPALILACIVAEGLRHWPDEKRKRAEFRMAVQSIGCALENIMVAANAEGLGSYWISAPLFCPDAVREALDLPPEYEAQALVSIGYPAGEPRPRAEPDLAKLIHTA